MPFLTVDHTRIYYRLEGMAGRPVLILSHSIGTDHGMWAPQAEELLPHYQVLRYDTRGHGASDAPQGDYSVERLGRDVLGLADALGIAQFAFCGLSLGGAIGQRLALHAPERVTGLVLANTSPHFGPLSEWDGRRRMVLDERGVSARDLGDLEAEALRAERKPLLARVRESRLGGLDSLGLGACGEREEREEDDATHTLLPRSWRQPVESRRTSPRANSACASSRTCTARGRRGESRGAARRRSGA